MEQTNQKTYVCKRARMCSFLETKGFYPYKIAPDRDNPMYDVFLFTASPELYQAVMEYINTRDDRMIPPSAGVKFGKEASSMNSNQQAAILSAAIKNIPVVAKRGDLNTRRSDSEDFFEVSVWSLKAALDAAYDAGCIAQTHEVENVAKSLMNDNDKNMTDAADVYAQGYHDALVDIVYRFNSP